MSHEHPMSVPIGDDLVQACYDDFWKPLLGHVPSLSAIKSELYDFHTLMHDLPRLFDEITGGLISKPNTSIDAVLEVYREKRQADLDLAAQEAVEAAST